MRKERIRRFVRMGVILLCTVGASQTLAAEEPLGSAAEEEMFSSGEEMASTEGELPFSSDEMAEKPMRLSMEFKDANLGDVLKLFSQQTGISVIASHDVVDQEVTLYFEDVTVIDAFDQILRAGNLVYERLPESSIYVVKAQPKETMEEGKVRTITRLYRLKYARVSESILAKAAASFGDITPFEAKVDTESGTGGGARGGGGGAAGKGIDLVLKKLLTSEGDIVVDPRTNSLLITDVPENFPRLEGAILALDVRTSQIMVEAEAVETTLTKLKDLGVEWGTGTEGDLITFTPGSRSTRFPFGLLRDGIAPTSPTAFSASTLDVASFKGLLQALESDSDTKILARPRVLTLDNESAVIRLTANEAIGFQTSSQAQTGTQSSTPEREITGVVLVVTPQVNENNYITMIVEPSVTKTVASQITPPSGQAQTRDPKTRSSRTIVRIRSGDTLVVGGLIDRSEQESLRQVPILSGIPVIGEAFKNSEINNSSSELIVFITPRLLDEPAESQLAATLRTPLGAREQEPVGVRQDTIEHTLNTFEQDSF